MDVNTQAPEHCNYRQDGSLEVVNVFHTIQGEGIYAGMPAIFVRLAGCNLKCPLCDTDYTSNRELLTMDELCERMLTCRDPRTLMPRLIVFTGGEPMRQNLSPIVKRLLTYSENLVQIETNGTQFDEHLPYYESRLSVVVSPKTHSLHPLIRPHIAAYKYVVEHGEVDAVDGLPTRVLGKRCIVARPWLTGDTPAQSKHMIFVQPLDEKDPERNRRHMYEAVQSCLRFNYRLSVQLHKLAGLE